MQSPELVALELSVLLFLVHTITQAQLARAEFGMKYQVGARDEKHRVVGLVAGRAERALANFLENYTPFVALDLALVATGKTGGWGAIVWIIGRIIYLPIYLAGVPVTRTICWGVGVLGLLMMLGRLAGI